jgi:hypothetical protein
MIRHPGRGVIDPIRVQVQIDVARASRFIELACPPTRRRVIVFGRTDRPVAQRQQQVFAQRPGEQIGRGADIADPPADNGERQIGKVLAADHDPSAARRHEPGQQLRQFALAAAALADDRDMFVKPQVERDGVDDAAAIILGQRQIADQDLALQPWNGFRLVEQQLRAGKPGRLELLDDLLVDDPRIFLVLVKVEQLLPRRGDVFVRRQHRYQRAEGQLAADHQVSADRVEKERH